MRFPPILSIVSLFTPILAQYPATPSGLTNVQSKLQPEVKISYKETHICETTPGVKSYSGYVHLPASVLADVGTYNISTFFWYFEARHNAKTAPLAIYLAGGPGEPSIYAALSSESGPCYVNLDGNSTTLNPWSFNSHVNVLYIDQPASVGFSYSSLINGTTDLTTLDVFPDPVSGGTSQMNASTLAGIFANQDPLKTSNNSISTAKALWHFTENWLTSFPPYKSTDKHISIWANSYGGYYAPAAVAYFSRKLKDVHKAHPLCGFKMDTLGITNGCVDMLVSTPEYVSYAHNNTYDLQLFSDQMYKEASHNYSKPGGCRDLITQCRSLGQLGDPDWIGANVTVNEACALATQYCFGFVIQDLNTVANRSNFDIAVKTPDPCPFYTPVVTYLNQPYIQAALGVPLNFTVNSNVVAAMFVLPASPATASIPGTGDTFRRSIAEFNSVLQEGVKVSMIFGDRDYRCIWLGGEQTALAAQWEGAEQFKKSGFEKVSNEGAELKAVVKQYDALSFARVFEAGHSISAYQPETVARIFERAMFGKDIATGGKNREGYMSRGPVSSEGIRNVLPPVPETCMVEGRFQDALPVS